MADEEANLTELVKFAKTFKLASPMPTGLKKILKTDERTPGPLRTVADQAKTQKTAEKPENNENDEKKHEESGLNAPLGKNQSQSPPKLWSDVARRAPSRAGESNSLQPGGILTPSSIYSSSLGAPTRSTRETQTTTPTSVSSSSNPMHPRKNPKVARGVMEDIQEDDEQPLVEFQMSASGGDGTNEYDGVSLASQPSTIYTPQQRDHVIGRFLHAMLKSLRPDSNYNAANESSRQHALPHLQSALKTFTEIVEVNPSAGTQVKATKMIRRLRPEIARKFQDAVLHTDQAAETKREPINLVHHGKQMEYSDKISRWITTDSPLILLDNLLAAAQDDQHQAVSEANSESSFGLPARTDTPWSPGIRKYRITMPLSCTDPSIQEKS